MTACKTFHDTVKALRAPDGCPWDREQTFATLRPFMIEECYEAVAACTALTENKAGAGAQFCDELGDVLLQVFLNSALAEEQNLFNLTDVFNAINEKMIRRHPHVFKREASAKLSVNEVLSQWADIKKVEVGTDPEKTKSLLHKATKKSVLPTLAFGCAISKNSLEVGFQWTAIKDVFGDLESEVRELAAEIFQPNPDVKKIEDEAGDVIYALCNVITFLRERTEAGKHLDLDIAARNAFNKFTTRFSEMEKIRTERGLPLTKESAQSLDLDEWNNLWKEAKRRLAKPQ